MRRNKKRIKTIQLENAKIARQTKKKNETQQPYDHNICFLDHIRLLTETIDQDR